MRDEARYEAPDVSTGARGLDRPRLPRVRRALAGRAAAVFPPDGDGIDAIPPHAFSEPRLQEAPRADRERLEAQQAAELRGYRWIDREAGIAHIPIEDAMALVASRGARAYAPLQPPPGGSPEQRR